MQVVILCGGTGTRLREQTEFVPKPLIPIGGIPMVVHIMRWYAMWGYNDFILALGYKQEQFKEYFSHYRIINSDIRVTTADEGVYLNTAKADNFDVVLSYTGMDTEKGSRLKRIEKYIKGDTFMVTYGDGISNVNLDSLLNFHEVHGKLVTITGVHPEPRFGEIFHTNGKVHAFQEKHDNNCLVNGGFMVMNRGVFDYLTPDNCDLEKGPLELLTAKGELMVYHHQGFWSCMDTLKDVGVLQHLWDEGRAPWKT